MHVVHEAEDPALRVTSSLPETLPDAGLLRSAAGNIVEDTLVSELPLSRGEPSSLERAVREREEGEESDGDRDRALDDLYRISKLLK